MRPLSELLQLVYDSYNNPELINNGENWFYSGLCSCIDDMENNEKLKASERQRLKSYLFENRPKRISHIEALRCHHWKPYKLYPRNRFLKKHIKINKLKENNN